jgi:acyl dehydratase
MSLNTSVVGVEWEGAETTWDSKDSLLYALGVGAGSPDPSRELQFTTENSHDVTQRVLPTFAAVAAGLRGVTKGPDLGDFPLEAILHAEQGVTLHGDLPTAATVVTRSVVRGMYDKGRDAVIALDATTSDVRTGAPLFTTRTGIFVRGQGGFGGDRGTTVPWEQPSGDPDHVVELDTRPEQALVYRLSGDRNPLHSDPWFAQKAGFDTPILHGLCTYGVTGRALLSALCEDDPSRFGSMDVRFSKPTYPGRTLRVEMWLDETGARFRTSDGENVVLDRGLFTWAPHA